MANKYKLGIVVTMLVFCGLLYVLVISEYRKPKYIFYDNDGLYTIERILVDNDIDLNDVDCCLKWAFGEDCKFLELRDLDDRWRQRHNDLFIIEGHDSIIESTKKIAEAWLELQAN